MIKIYIARHGETTWNVEGRIQGRSDPGLSPKGDDQRLALLSHLRSRPLSAIYTSTLQRSVLTAQPLAQHLNLSIQRQSELDEIAFGILEGEYFFQFNDVGRAEWERFKEDRFSYRIPQAENYSDVAIRVKPFAERILQIHQNEEILIVGHRVVNQILIGMLLGCTWEKVLKLQQTNDCIYLIERNGETRVFHTLDGEMKEGFLLLKKDILLSNM